MLVYAESTWINLSADAKVILAFSVVGGDLDILLEGAGLLDGVECNFDFSIFTGHDGLSGVGGSGAPATHSDMFNHFGFGRSVGVVECVADFTSGLFNFTEIPSVNFEQKWGSRVTLDLSIEHPCA